MYVKCNQYYHCNPFLTNVCYWLKKHIHTQDIYNIQLYKIIKKNSY